MAKYKIITEYYNPILKVFESQKLTPCLKKSFTGWDDYAKLKKSQQ